MSSAQQTGFRVGPDADPDRYVLGAAVASGAEGILYRGSITTATGFELDVAIKMLQPRFLSRVDEWHARWAEQVELLRSLQVPGVVRVRDGFLGPLPHGPGEAGADRTLYLVMNWVDGEPLDEWVRRRPDRDPVEALKLLLGVAVALDLMHTGRATGGIPVVHRDVKPSNILITDEGSVLVDFGLTRGLPEGQRQSGVTGTPGYVPPEATESGTYTPATDRYALGAVAYFVLTGNEPPRNHDPEAMRAALLALPAVAARPDTVDLIMAMLDADPDARPPALGNWIGQLRRSSLTYLPDALAPEAPGRNPGPPSGEFQPTEPERSDPSPSARRSGRSSSRPMAAVVATLAAAAVFAAIAVGLAVDDPPDRPETAVLAGAPGTDPSTSTITAPVLPLATTAAAPAAVPAPAPVGAEPMVTAPAPQPTVPLSEQKPMTTETIDYERPGAPPSVPEGVTVELQLASTKLVVGQVTKATVRFRNNTDKKFYILVGCGVAFVEVISPEGKLVGRNAEGPCGTGPDYYFSNSTIPARGQVERVFDVTVDPSAIAGPAEVRAAWARDTGAGIIYYVSSAPTAVTVARP